MALPLLVLALTSRPLVAQTPPPSARVDSGRPAAASPRANAGAVLRGPGRLSEGLDWLAGCWEARRASGVLIEEMWTAPRGGLLLGASRTTRPAAGPRAETLLGFETARVIERGDTLVFWAQPATQPAASFRADTVRSGLVSFHNPAHDFPQRIRYATAGPDSLVAEVSGPGPGGSTRREQFRYARVACAGAPGRR